jgi:hypothetical protein
MQRVTVANGRLLSLLMYTFQEVMLSSVWHKVHLWKLCASNRTYFQSRNLSTFISLEMMEDKTDYSCNSISDHPN